MIVHKKKSTRAKSKIILLQKPSTKLLSKKKKITKSINKTRKSTTYFYKKIELNIIMASLKIQYSLTIHHKVHSLLVDHLTRRRIKQITS